MKKIRIIPLLGLLVPVLVAPAAFADAGADLKQAEGLYEAGQYTQAEQAYLTVVREADPNKPADAEAAFNARKKLASVYIATDRLPQAKEAVRQLLSRYAQYEFLPHAIHEIAEGAKPLLKLPQVRQLYQDMVTAQPGDAQAIWLKMGIAVASAYLAEDQAVDATLQNIISQHGADDRAAEALNHIAWAYRKLQRCNEALTIYQYVVNNWPQKDRVVFAQQGIAICQLQLGDRQAADVALEVMLQKFGKDENTPKLLAWAIYGYLQAGEIEGAYNIFDVVLQTYPEAPETIDALLTLATAAIQDEDRARIEPVVQTLLTRFAPTQAKAAALHTVANMLAWKCVDYVKQRLEEQNLPGICNRCLRAIANYTLATWPGSDWAMWAQRDLATVALQTGDAAAAEAAITQLSTDYADRQETPDALNFVANHLLEVRNNKAEAVYQHFAEKYPGHKLMPIVEAGLARARISQGDVTGAETLTEKILADYASHPRLCEAVHLVAEGYYDRARALESEQIKNAGGVRQFAMSTRSQECPEAVRDCLRRAIEKWQIVFKQPVETANVPPIAYILAADSCRRIGDCRKALEYYSAVVDRYPQYKYVDHALLMVGKTCERLQTQGLMTESEAWPVMLRTSQALLDQYPQSQYVPSARDIVDRITAAKARRKELRNEE
jgi:TolA-binding protein